MAIEAIILMTDYGNDPTEVATPFTIFKEKGHFNVSFATETGNPPACDKKMYKGLTQKLLGAQQPAVKQHADMQSAPAYQEPLSWTADDFDLKKFDLVFLPGGHEKGMQQIIGSKSLHKQLAEYVPLTKGNEPSGKCLGAICHGVQVLAEANHRDDESKSVIHDFETTALPGTMEQGIFWATRPFLGDYYKTYGPSSDSVQRIVSKRLNDPKTQYKNSLSMSPFVHKDPNYRYWSGRFPPDAELLANKIVEMVNETKATRTNEVVDETKTVPTDETVNETKPVQTNEIENETKSAESVETVDETNTTQPHDVLNETKPAQPNKGADESNVVQTNQMIDETQPDQTKTETLAA